MRILTYILLLNELLSSFNMCLLFTVNAVTCYEYLMNVNNNNNSSNLLIYEFPKHFYI